VIAFSVPHSAFLGHQVGAAHAQQHGNAAAQGGGVLVVGLIMGVGQHEAVVAAVSPRSSR